MALAVVWRGRFRVGWATGFEMVAMRKLAILATFAIAGLALAFCLSRPGPPPVALHVVKVTPFPGRDAVFVEFAVHNPDALAFQPERLETWINGRWVPGQAKLGFGLCGEDTTRVMLTFPKVHGRVRLRVETFRPTHGLATFWGRLQQGLVNRSVAPLDPFGTPMRIYRRQREVVSDEFEVR